MKFLILGLLVLTGCQNPIKKVIDETTYSAYELVGIEKRDLLRRRIAAARDEQKEASEEFKDALEQLKKVYGFDGGNLEREYNSLNSAYEDARNKVSDVQKSIVNMDKVAGDLFKEWESEIKEIKSETYKAKSRESLKNTKARYQDLLSTLRTSEKKMSPVLRKLKDNVLYLKHNLNAQAVGSLKKEATRIHLDLPELDSELLSLGGYNGHEIACLQSAGHDGTYILPYQEGAEYIWLETMGGYYSLSRTEIRRDSHPNKIIITLKD